MELLNGHIAIMPPVYNIQIGIWRWCKLDEVCEVVWGLRQINGTNFAPNGPDLISRFAALTRPNRFSLDPPGSARKKIFRYSRNGTQFWGTEVPVGHEAPPYKPFQLEYANNPYPSILFVPEGWVIDTLKAVQQGCVAAADFGEFKLGFRPRNRSGSLFCITLAGKKFEGLVKFPNCVEL